METWAPLNYRQEAGEKEPAWRRCQHFLPGVHGRRVGWVKVSTPPRSRAESLRRQRSVFSAFILLLQAARATFLWTFPCGRRIHSSARTKQLHEQDPTFCFRVTRPANISGRAQEGLELGRWDGGKEEQFCQPIEKGASSGPTQCWLDISPNWVQYTTCPTIRDGPAQEIGALPSRNPIGTIKKG